MIKIFAFITFDVEQDCPPYLKSEKGMKEGLPKVLDILEEKKIKATFFTTGAMAKKYPNLMKRIIDYGHELGIHSYNHERFDKLSYFWKEKVIEKSVKILNRYTNSVISFRAPNLKFSIKDFEVLLKYNIKVDSSLTWYKGYFSGVREISGIIEVPPSITSSYLRTPFLFQKASLNFLPKPLVFFFHPWEFVEMKNVRLDCKIGTGKYALENLRKLIEYLKKKKVKFLRIKDVYYSRSFLSLRSLS